MPRSNLIARSLNDLGAAAWFGAALIGLTATNTAPVVRADATERHRSSNAIEERWWPIQVAAMSAHLLGGALLTVGNRERIIAQRGVASLSLARTAVTAAAVSATVYVGRLDRRRSKPGDAPVQDATVPTGASTSPPDPVVTGQQGIRWAVVVLTGALIVLNAAQGEQQRPSRTLRGVMRRLHPTR